MAFLARVLRTLTLAFAARHFLDPVPLGRGPRAPKKCCYQPVISKVNPRRLFNFRLDF